MRIPGRWMVLLIAFVALRVGAPGPAEACRCCPCQYPGGDAMCWSDVDCGSCKEHGGTILNCSLCSGTEECAETTYCSEDPQGCFPEPAPTPTPTPGVPPEWTCDPSYYGDGEDCDCGCGALDPDCEDATVESCDYCGEDGACDAGDESCSTIDPTQNWLCGAAPTATPTTTPTQTPTPTPLALGDTCTSGTQCASTFCASGVCCNTACDQPFQQCNLPGRVGLCSLTGAPAPATSTPGLILVALLLCGVGVFVLARRRIRSSGEFR